MYINCVCIHLRAGTMPSGCHLCAPSPWFQPTEHVLMAIARPSPSCCGIDFGTSNSAIAVANSQTSQAMQLVPLEGAHLSMPTAVFYCTDADDLPDSSHRVPRGQAGLPKSFGRAAVAAYIDGYEGRLMRSMKSILGSGMVDQTTEVGQGHGVKYLDIITDYLRHLRARAQDSAGHEVTHVVMGRPVFFVDDEPERDAQAQASLLAAARAVGFQEVVFQYEPIAAAFDHEQHITQEERVLVADIGGGTSDFSVVRVGPQRKLRNDRRDDILSSHGIHIAGTDFDRHVSLATIMPTLGHGAYGPSVLGQPPKPVPSRVYMDLSTWHLINTVYGPQRMAELQGMVDFYGDPVHHQRLMRVLADRLGHALLGKAEEAKIALAEGGHTVMDLHRVERDLNCAFDAEQARAALAHDVQRIVQCAADTVRMAGLQAHELDALFFTGGSTGLNLLTDALQAAFPGARVVRGDRMGSVATGLGLMAQRVFG